MKTVKAVIAYVKKVFSFIKSILSETDGSGSASRTVKIMVVGGSVLCLVLVTCWKHDLPTPEQLKALAEVIGAGSAAYAANIAGKALSKARGGQAEAPADDSEGGKS